MVTVAAHQSVTSWLKCVFKPTMCLLCSQRTKTFFFSLFVFWKLIISHQIINLPEGKKEHCKVRCLNQGRWSLFTCIPNYRKLVLNPSKLKRFFYLFRLSCQKRIRPRPQESSSRGGGRAAQSGEKSPADNWKQEVSQLRELLADKEQQVSRAMRSRQTNCRTCKDLDPDLDPAEPDRSHSKREQAQVCFMRGRAPQTGEGGRREPSQRAAGERKALQDKEDVRRQEFSQLWAAVGWRAGKVSSRAASARTEEAEAPRRRWDLSEAGTPEKSFSCSLDAFLRSIFKQNRISLKAEGDGSYRRRKRSKQPV